MSAPGLEFREAEYLGISHMAITSDELIVRLLSGRQLSNDDKQRLRKAKKFLEDVSSGARLVTSGVSSNVSAVETVRKLTYTMEPLKLVGDGINTAAAEAIFQQMAVAIGSAVDDGSIDREKLQLASSFLRQLHLSLVNLTEASNRRTGVSLDVGNPLRVAYA